ncbi:MAG: glycosyltransferase family 2 protein [Verrucomicrobiota bacterium]|nr:glycosyltransferase family 2 protein [Verrucomicrobiota bacterium]
MKLQAVTICINYADFLECIVRNQRHFDRWIIVTVPEDHETIAVCRRHGLEFLFSRVLRPDGRDFHSSFNKSRILNEGLDALDQHGWTAILDSDVLLPRHFREQVCALPLECGALYGMAGRKICPDRDMFEALKWCEPWDRFCHAISSSRVECS